jgi:hypothetical protein
VNTVGLDDLVEPPGRRAAFPCGVVHGRQKAACF